MAIRRLFSEALSPACAVGSLLGLGVCVLTACASDTHNGAPVSPSAEGGLTPNSRPNGVTANAGGSRNSNSGDATGAVTGDGATGSGNSSGSGGTQPAGGAPNGNKGGKGSQATGGGGGSSGGGGAAQGNGGAVQGNGGASQGNGGAVFPLSVSSDGRYLVDKSGKPFRIHGDTEWDICDSATLSDLRTYLDDRKSRGFNAIVAQITDPVRYFADSTAPASKGANGALPFLKNASGGTWDGDPGFAGNNIGQGGPFHFDADFSSPNPAFFAWIDTVLNEANSRGMLVILTACYLGYNQGSNDGWWQTLLNSVNTQDVAFGFGQYLGNRYKNFPNIMWEAGVDMLPPPGSEGEKRAHKVLEGIKAAGDTHLWEGHWVHDTLSTDEAAFAGDMTVEAVYTHGAYPAIGPTYGLSRKAYARTPVLPAFLVETSYEGEHNTTPAQEREFMWGADLSTIGGYVFGNDPVDAFHTGWQTALNSQGAHDMQRMGALLDSLPWQNLVPSGLAGMRTLITAGTGTYTSLSADGEQGGDDWVVSAATKDGKYLIAYVPDQHSGPITVDLTALSGTARVRWFDPTNAAFTQVGNYPNTGARAFTTPGKNSSGAADWVLLADVQ